jgi:flagellar hook-associated protein 1
MTLDGTLSIATGGLANINRQMAVVSQNVANASTPGYAVEISTQESLTGNGEGLGVRSGPAIRDIDMALQAETLSQNATVAGLQTRQNALQAIDAVQGTPGQSGDIAGLLGNLQDQFSTLLNSPDNQTQQSQVVSAATNVAQGINVLSNAYTSQRQTAQDAIVSEVATLNATLSTIGGLSDKIVTLKAGGQSIADLENQRDTAVASLSQVLDVKALEQPSGDLLIITQSGLTLPIRGASPFGVADANIAPGSGAPPIMLRGTDVTAQMQGGQIGANVTLRDTTMPTDQAELDELAQNLAGRFDAQGLTLFTDPNGAVPPSAPVGAPPPPVQTGYVGFAATIQVNPTLSPSAVRDGTPSISGGLAGFTGIISAVLNNVLGAVPALASQVLGLGSAGNLNAPYVAPATLQQLASTMVAAQAQDSATTTSQLGTEQAVQTTLATKLSAQSGVNMDTEMSTMIQLQNAYGANAKVIAAVQAMWTQLLSTVQ